MFAFEKLKELNESGELPKYFTDEELMNIAKAESMMCGAGCAFCPLAPYEFGNTPKEDKKQEPQEKKEDNNG